MPKPVNPSRGKCQCRVKGCTELADIKTLKNHDQGALYMVCPVHGKDSAQGAAAQAALDDWIIEHAIPEGAEKVPEPEPAQEPERVEQGAKGAEPEKPATARAGLEPGRKGPGFLAQANEELNELFS